MLALDPPVPVTARVNRASMHRATRWPSGHATADLTPEEPKAPTEQPKAAGITPALRSRAEFTRFFDGLEMIEPGVGLPQLWQPGLGGAGSRSERGLIPGYGTVGRKP